MFLSRCPYRPMSKDLFHVTSKNNNKKTHSYIFLVEDQLRLRIFSEK